MPTSPKSFEQSLRAMVEYVSTTTGQVTDFNQGSVIRTILEAVAIEVERLYSQALLGAADAILLAGFSAFDFSRNPAVAAYGLVRFTWDNTTTRPTTIPVGSQVKIPDTSKVYETVEEGEIDDPDTTVDILVQAIETGVLGNAAASTITELVTPISGIASITNPNAFITGRDEEGDDQMRARFAQFRERIHRGTKSSLEFGATTTSIKDDNGFVLERVVKAKLIENAPGDIDLFVHNGLGGTGGSITGTGGATGTDETNLITECQAIIDGYQDDDGKRIPGWKAAGIPCPVSAASDQSVAVTAALTLHEGFELAMVETDVKLAIDRVFAALSIGQTLRRNMLIRAITNVRGVADVVLTAPAEDVAATNSNTLILVGTKTIS